MPPTTENKPKQFALTMSEEEFQMLKELAADARDSAAETVRALVRAAYTKRFKNKVPGADTLPTMRAILEDIAGPVHYTGGNIAERTGLPLPRLQQILLTLEKRGIVECIDHMKPLPNQPNAEEGQNWTWQLRIPHHRVDVALAKVGFDPDADLTLR